MSTDCPVLLIIFNRADTTRRVFEAIRAVRPKQLFISADGPRTHIPTDREKCANTRSVANQVDWDCEVKTRFLEDNVGCRRGVESAIDWFFSHVDRGIILEDDCAPSPSFFPFCSELLDRYSHVPEVMTISGTNFHRCCFEAETSYFFSKYMHCWGWATWRRAWQHYNTDLTLNAGETVEDVIRNYPTTKAEVRYWYKRIRAARMWDYHWLFSIWQQRGLNIVPRVNLVQNIGFGSDATHTLHATDTLSIPAGVLQIDSHPVKIEQCLEADQHEAAHLFRIGNRSLWDRCKRETKNLLRRLSA